MRSRITRTGCGLLGPVLVILAACDGGGESLGPGEDPDGPLPGSVLVDNRTPWGVEVAWLWQDGDGGDQVLRVSVPSGEVRGLTNSPWAAGTQVALDLVLLVPPELGPRVRRKANVQINGDRVVVVQASADDPFGVVVATDGGTMN